jgi:hypothetical protein
MKLLVTALLFTAVSANNRYTFCGDKPCTIAFTEFSCEEFIQNYEFLGSCCRLVDIPATGGCRVEVGSVPGLAKANCAWVPRCGSCDPNADVICGWTYETSTTDTPCLDEAYDAKAIQDAWEQAANTTAPVEGASEAPSPVYFVEELQTSCPPTAAPVEQPEETAAPEPSSTSSSSVVVATFAVATAIATAFTVAL